MLLQFNFENYKSFKNKVSLDMTAANISENNNHVVSIANNKILKVAAIYGANASGKTNVYEALEFMLQYVIQSFSFGDESPRDTEKRLDLQAAPFIFDNASAQSPSTFEVYFIDTINAKQKIYQYGFSIKKNIVIEEWLYSKAKTSNEFKNIFYREQNQDIAFNSTIRASDGNFIKKALNEETLILSLGAKLKIDILDSIRNWFAKLDIISFGEPVEAFFRATTVPPDFTDKETVRHDIINYFSTFDSSIKDFEVEKVESEENDYYKINSIHSSSTVNDNPSIPLNNESAGTLKMFALYPSLKEVFENGGLLVIDELNAKLHPLLVRNILISFLNPEININNAQIIFTTHDVWQLSTGLLRRDEIWFADKDDEGISDLYSLADFKDENDQKIRKDAAFERNYVTGSYRAIPSLKPINILKDNKNEK